MSMTESGVVRVLLIDRLIAVRQAVDDALRVLSEAEGTPPPMDSPQPADSTAPAGDSKPVGSFGVGLGGCKHDYVDASFGSSDRICRKCGDRSKE